MKRYRVLPFYDFDTRVRTLVDPINDNWEENVKKQYYENKKQEKLKRIPKEALSSGQSTVLHYAEIIEEIISELSIKLLSGQDNLVCSPSATAWLYAKTNNITQKNICKIA